MVITFLLSCNDVNFLELRPLIFVHSLLSTVSKKKFFHNCNGIFLGDLSHLHICLDMKSRDFRCGETFKHNKCCEI